MTDMPDFRSIMSTTGRGVLGFAKGVGTEIARRDNTALGIVMDALIERPEEKEASLERTRRQAEFENWKLVTQQQQEDRARHLKQEQETQAFVGQQRVHERTTWSRDDLKFNQQQEDRERGLKEHAADREFLAKEKARQEKLWMRQDTAHERMIAAEDEQRASKMAGDISKMSEDEGLNTLRSYYQDMTGEPMDNPTEALARNTEQFRDWTEVLTGIRLALAAEQVPGMDRERDRALAAGGMSVRTDPDTGVSLIFHPRFGERPITKQDLVRLQSRASEEVAKEIYGVIQYSLAKKQAALGSISDFTDAAVGAGVGISYREATDRLSGVIAKASPEDQTFHALMNLADRAVSEPNPMIRAEVGAQAMAILQGPQMRQRVWLVNEDPDPRKAYVQFRGEAQPRQLSDILENRAQFDPIYRQMQDSTGVLIEGRKSEMRVEQEQKIADAQARFDDWLLRNKITTQQELEREARSLQAQLEKEQRLTIEQAIDVSFRLGASGTEVSPNMTEKLLKAGLTPDDVENQRAAGKNWAIKKGIMDSPVRVTPISDEELNAIVDGLMGKK